MSPKPWTEDQTRILREMYPTNSCRAIALKIDKSASAVKARVSLLKLKHAPGYNRMAHSIKAIPDSKREFIRANYTKYTNHDLAKLAGCSESFIGTIRKAGGFTKENTGRIKKGNRPWNFRTKGLIKSTPGMKMTQFKKGQHPVNTLHDGVITIRLDHPKDRNGRPYQWVRIGLGKWVMFHRWFWEQANGPVPKGHVIIFRDSDTMNCSIENLKCITMRENLARNYSKEKVGKASKELSDNYIAGRLAGGDKDLRRALIHAAPELIELKREQLKLKRQINHERENKVRKTA